MKKDGIKQTFQKLLPALTALAAAFAAWGQLELSDSVPAAFAAGQWPLWAPLNAGLAFCLTLLLFAALGRWWLATAVSGAVWTVLALVNYYTRDLHGTALVPQDIRNAGTAAEVLGTYTLHIRGTVLCIAALYLPVLAAALWLRRRERGQSKTAAVRRWIGFLAGAAIVFGVTVPLLPGNETGWDWQEVYYTHGFLAGTLKSCARLARPAVEPEGYTPQAAAALLDRYALAYDPPADPPDVLLVLSESFYDLNLVTNLQNDVDFLANYNALPGALRGHARSPHIGGGTNNSEYTLLTSNSQRLLPGATPFNALDLTGAESLVSHLESLGYATMAAHPYTAGNYRRDAAWTAMGFDETHFLADFPTDETYGARPYRTDAAAYADWLALYEAIPADRPRFAFLVTIQNHGDYEMNDAALDTVHAGRDLGAYDSTVDEYLSCLALTDAALPQLTGALTELYEQTGRRVVLALVGDHAPSFVDHIADKGGIAYEALLERERSVPYLIWTNWPADLPAAPAEPLSMTALAPLVLRAAGLPLTPYDCYIEALQSDESLRQGYLWLEYDRLTNR